MLKVGDKVKDFTLLDFNGKSHTLSNHLGKKVVVYFYPKITRLDVLNKLVILEIIFMKLKVKM